LLFSNFQVSAVSDFLIVGGGIIGMMLARQLGLEGASVTLVEQGNCAGESSWAGGGIVSPLYPWRHSQPVTHLASWSQSTYLHLVPQLLEETGVDSELMQTGMYMVNVADQQLAIDWARRYLRPVEEVAASHLYRHEPALNEGFSSAVWMPEVASVRNPRLGRAMRESLLHIPNLTLLEQCSVSGLILEGEKIVGVSSANGEIKAGHTILCAGAWTAELLKPLGIALPVQPVKGQMMVFKAKPGLLNRVVLLEDRYLIPRRDGRILVGSTLEHQGFDKTPTSQARESLYQTALNIMPALADFPVEHHWAGLRPGSPEGIPYIGQVPGYRGLSVNAGQFRNGLVLAPASTKLQADMLLGRTSIIDPAPYALEGRVELK